MYHNLEKFGGAENNLVNLILESSKGKNVIDFYTFGISNYYRKLIEKKVNLKILKAPRILTKQPLVWLYIKVFNFLGKNKFLEDYDAVNIHAYPMHWMAEGITKKVVWNCNEPPMTYFPQRARNPLEKSIRNSLKSFFFDNFERPMVREHVDQIVVLDKGRQVLVKKLYGVMPKIVRIGVNTDLYRPKSRKNTNKINILFVSRLDEHKRIADFLAALDILEKKFGDKAQNIFEVYVIGAGPQESLLQNFIKTHNIKINYLKNVSDEKVVDIYNKGNILVFPAVNQPWGLVPFEAMACKCAVIVSKDTGAAEVLTHMRNSILISAYNPAEISDWIERLINDKTLLKRISENGFLFVHKNLTLEKYTAQILELLKS